MNVIFKTKVFHRWAVNEGLNNQALCDAIAEVEQGLVEAALGAYLFKKRVAREGYGKSGSYRRLLRLKKLSQNLMNYTQKQLGEALNQGALIKVECENE